MTEQTKRFYPLIWLGDGLLLLCAVLGLTVSFLSLYSDPLFLLGAYLSERGLGPLCGWAVLFALLSLTAWSLPRFRLAAGGSLFAVWAGLVLWNWDMLWQGGGLTIQSISQQFADRVSWGEVLEFETVLTSLPECLDAMELFLILTLAGIALLVGLAVVEGKCWWFAILLTLPPLLPGLLADLFPSWPAFMTLCACWCTLLFTRSCRNAAPSSRGRLTLAVLPAIGLTLACLTLALPRETYTRPVWAYAAEEKLTNMASHLSYLFEGVDGPFQSTVTYVGAAETVDLNNAGPLNYSGRTVLRVKSDYTGHLYLRGVSLGAYDGRSWSALPDTAYQEYLDEIDRYSALNPSPLIFPNLMLSEKLPTHTITVENVGAAGSCVYAPYQLVDQNWADEGILPVEDAFLARLRGQWTQTMTFEERGPGTSAVGQPDYASLAYRHEKVYQDYVKRHYLDVPPELEDVLGQFMAEGTEPGLFIIEDTPILSSSLFSSHTQHTPYINEVLHTLNYVELVTEQLHELCKYDPNTPLTPAGEDFVEYFLTTSRQGYCMHFASAATLILRSRGIPARYVSGFTVDTVDGKQVDVPDYAAHAWVEVYIDSYGWYPVEVTPNYDQETGTPDIIDNDAPPIPGSQPPEESDGPVPSDDVPETSLPPQGVDNSSGTGGAGLLRVLLWAAAITGTVGLLWLAQYLTKKYRTARLSGSDSNRAALDGYRYLLRLQRWGGKLDDDILALAQKAKFSQHTLTPEEQQTMTACVERERLRLSRSLPLFQRLVFRFWWGKPKKR